MLSVKHARCSEQSRKNKPTGKSKVKGGREKVLGKGEGPRENWEKVQVLRICRGVGVFPSRVIRDEYRI